MVTAVLVLTSSINVFAEEVVTEEVTSNMDAETYEARRLAQIDQALADGLITSEQAEILREHVAEVIAEGSFGSRGEKNTECVLGDDESLGIFRSAGAGMRTGQGNGVGQRLADGTGAGGGNRSGANGAGRGQGNGYDGDCILD